MAYTAVYYVYVYIVKRLCPAGKPFVETAVWRGSIVVPGVYSCAPCILLGSGHQKEQRGTPDFLSERRTQYRQLIIIAWAKEKRKAIPQLLRCLLSPGSAYTPYHIYVYIYTFCRKLRPCSDIFLRDIITTLYFPRNNPPARSFNYGR